MIREGGGNSTVAKDNLAVKVERSFDAPLDIPVRFEK